jgi:flagellin
MTALQTLQGISKNMDTTQSRISTGLKVATAADNAAYWSIATTMRSDNQAMSSVKDALGLGEATVDVAYTAMKSAIDVTDEIKSKLVAAQTPGVDRGKIQDEINVLQNQLEKVAGAASFNEQNWLSVDSSAAGYNATKSIVASFTRSGGAVAVGTIDIDTTSTKLYDANLQSGMLDRDRTVGVTTAKVSTLDISALTDSAADKTTLGELTSMVDAAVAEMTDAATNLGAVKKQVGLQKDFVSNLMSAVDRGVGQLVDADMNEESTRLQALQVQSQLGIQALSIANQNTQSILSLFR